MTIKICSLSTMEVYIPTFKHLRDENGKIYATVCRIRSPKQVGIGIAILGEKENFSRKEGNQKSFDRAIQAFVFHKCSEYINQSQHPNVKKILDHPDFILPYKSIFRKFK